MSDHSHLHCANCGACAPIDAEFGEYHCTPTGFGFTSSCGPWISDTQAAIDLDIGPMVQAFEKVIPESTPALVVFAALRTVRNRADKTAPPQMRILIQKIEESIDALFESEAMRTH